MKVLESNAEIRERNLSENFTELRKSVKSNFDKFLVKMNLYLDEKFEPNEENHELANFIQSNFRSLKGDKFRDIYDANFEDYTHALKFKLLKFWLRSGEKIMVNLHT